MNLSDKLKLIEDNADDIIMFLEEWRNGKGTRKKNRDQTLDMSQGFRNLNTGQPDFRPPYEELANRSSNVVVFEQAADDPLGYTDAEINGLIAGCDPAGAAATAVASHVGAADPHTQYQKESEKDAASGYAGLSAASKLAGAQQTYGTTSNTACEGNDSRVTGAAQKASNLSDMASASTSWANIGGKNTGKVLGKFDATVAPGIGDDSTAGYEPGSLWVDVTADKGYVCLDASAGAAVWKEVTSVSSGGDVVGPAGATDEDIAVYNGVTGKAVKDGGKKVADLQLRSEKDAASGYAGLSAATKLAGAQQTYGTTSNTACEGNDSRLSDARTPTGHNTSHQSGGADSIKLDDLAAPDDNTDLDASTSKHGLLKKLSGTATEFMNGQGSWATPAGSVQDKIEEGNSKVEVIDTGTGYVSIYIDGSERFRLGTSGIYDASGNLLIGFSATASAVNYVKFTNSATSTPISLTVDGTDSNIPFEVKSKGTSSVLLTVGSYSFSIDSSGNCVVSQGDLQLMLGNMMLPSGGYVQVGSDAGVDNDIAFDDVGGQHIEISVRGGVVTRMVAM